MSPTENRCIQFEVAGVEGKFEPAVVEIEGNSLKEYSDKVKNPRYIRYAWHPFTRTNLVNDRVASVYVYCFKGWYRRLTFRCRITLHRLRLFSSL